MNLGDTVMACPKLLKLDFDPQTKRQTPIPGTVVYIHPTNRFYVLEFCFRGNIVRESFFSLPEMEKDFYEDDSNNEREGRRRQDRDHRKHGHHSG